MESVIESQSYLWIGSLYVVAYAVIKRLSDQGAKEVVKDQARSDDRSTLRMGVDIFLPDVLFLLAFVLSGLTSALIFRTAIAFWGLGRGWPFRPKPGPIFSIYKVLMVFALIAIVLTQSEAGLHAYGLIVFTVFYALLYRKFQPKLSKEEGGGMLNGIKVASLLLMSYLVLLAFSELLWKSGGLEWWIWFFIFLKPLTVVSLILSLNVLLPFLNILGKAINDTSKSLR